MCLGLEEEKGEAKINMEEYFGQDYDEYQASILPFFYLKRVPMN